MIPLKVLMALAALPSTAFVTAVIPRSGWDIPFDLSPDPFFGKPPTDWDCRSTVHPNPVVMLHGLSLNENILLSTLAHDLTDDGWCTYSLTYGAHPLAPWIGGLESMRESAGEIADFIKEVKEKTGADKVDIVGHSEGGVMALYVPMSQDGIADIVNHTVALGPAIHGAKYYGIADLWYIGGSTTRRLVSAALKVLGCHACDDMATDGDIYNDFKGADKIVPEGVKATVIMSTSDTLVKPEVSRVDEEGVNNVIVQESCEQSRVGHGALAVDKTVWGLVREALGEKDVEVECQKGLPF